MRRHRIVRDRARRRKAPMPGSFIQRGTRALDNRLARPRASRRRCDDLVRFLFWVGRTDLPKGETRYNPMAYHNGSIWPHDNSFIALGLSLYGLKDHSDTIFKGMLDAASCMELRRLPELFCGFRRRRATAPTLYPVACAPQAWASGTLFLMIRAALGIEFDVVGKAIIFRNPRLPPFCDQIVLKDLRMGEAIVDIELQRSGRHVSMRVLRNTGAVQVSMISVRGTPRLRISESFSGLRTLPSRAPSRLLHPFRQHAACTVEPSCAPLRDCPPADRPASLRRRVIDGWNNYGGIVFLLLQSWQKSRSRCVL